MRFHYPVNWITGPKCMHLIMIVKINDLINFNFFIDFYINKKYIDILIWKWISLSHWDHQIIISFLVQNTSNHSQISAKWIRCQCLLRAPRSRSLNWNWLILLKTSGRAYNHIFCVVITYFRNGNVINIRKTVFRKSEYGLNRNWRFS